MKRRSFFTLLAAVAIAPIAIAKGIKIPHRRVTQQDFDFAMICAACNRPDLFPELFSDPPAIRKSILPKARIITRYDGRFCGEVWEQLRIAVLTDGEILKSLRGIRSRARQLEYGPYVDRVVWDWMRNMGHA